MEKQKLYETRRHGTPRFPMECFITRTEGIQNFQFPLHWHRNVEIMQVLRGTTSVTIGNETFSGEEGDIFFINQEELHRVASEDDQLVYRTVIFPLQALTFSESDASQTYLEQLIQGTQRFPVQLTRKKDCDFLYALLYQIQNAAEQKSSGYELMVKALLLQMIAQMFCRHMMIPVQHAPSEKSQRLKEMLQYIRQHYAESDLSVEKLCAYLHLSSTYFSTLFKRETGTSFTAYVTTVRMEAAAEAIRGTEEKTYLIAQRCGYEDPNYFSYVFKRHFGVTPTKYRSEGK